MRHSGFTLVELMIVIAIIAIISAVAIPSILRSKISSNEATAISTLRTLATAQIAFSGARMVDGDSDGNGDFADTLLTLNQPPLGPPFLGDDVLASTNQKAGYAFQVTLNPDPDLGFAINADPITDRATGILHYMVDENMIIRFNINGPAGLADLPVS